MHPRAYGDIKRHFVTLMRQSQLSHNEIENYMCDIAQKHSTDDHDIIANIFLKQHACDDATGAVVDDVVGSRVEIKNFLRGCIDFEDQRAVRSHKSIGNSAMARTTVTVAATSTAVSTVAAASTSAAVSTSANTAANTAGDTSATISTTTTTGSSSATAAVRNGSVAISTGSNKSSKKV